MSANSKTKIPVGDEAGLQRKKKARSHYNLQKAEDFSFSLMFQSSLIFCSHVNNSHGSIPPTVLHLLYMLAVLQDCKLFEEVYLYFLYADTGLHLKQVQVYAQ